MIKRNIIANYIMEAYIALIGVVLLPIYINYMGKEAYGLVGFYVLLQSWLRMFDVGLTPTIGREAARYNGDKEDPARLIKLLHLFVGIFSIIAIIFILLSIEFSYEITTKWLTVEKLNLDEVASSVKIMAFVIALRWVSGLYRGIITGFEKFVWLSKYQILVATLRFVLVIPVLMYFYDSPVDFFSYQLVVAITETVILISYAYHLLPGRKHLRKDNTKLSGFSREFQFSGVIAFTGIVSLLIKQSDKFIISSILSLTQFAIFNVAVAVSNIVLVINRPISNVLRATITRLYAEGKKEKALSLYRNSTQLVTIGGTIISAFFLYCGHNLLLIWTGDPEIANGATKLLWLYGLANAMTAIAGMQIHLQYAEGVLRYHLYGNIIFALIILPMVYFLANTYGAMGAAIAVMLSSLIILISWVPIVHNKFAPGLHSKWLFNDVLIIFLSGFGSGFLVNQLLPTQQLGFIANILYLMVHITIIAFGCLLSSSYAKSYFINFVYPLIRDKIYVGNH